MNVLSSLCVYTTTQTIKFFESHLQAGGWYLDCSEGFVPGEEKPLFASLVSSAPDEYIVSFEEPDIVELPLPPPKAQRERREQRIPPLKPLPKLSLGLLQRPPFNHSPSYRVHLALPPLFHQLPPLVLPQPFVHKLLLLLTVAVLFSPCLARGRPPSWIRVPPLRSRLPHLPSSKMWRWCNSCWILSLQEFPSQHISTSKSSLPKFIYFPSSFFRLLFFLVCFFPCSCFLMKF